MVQPSAVMPPKPISMPPMMWLRRVLGVAEALPAEGARGERVGGRAGDHAGRRGDAVGDDLRLVGPQHQVLERVGERRDERERLHAAAVGGDEGLLQRVRVLGDVADVPAHVPAAHHHEPGDHAAQGVVEARAELRGWRRRTRAARRRSTTRASMAPAQARASDRQILARRQGDAPPSRARRRGRRRACRAASCRRRCRGTRTPRAT